eukprot:6276453-Alexandrium_andersonii.AAC.1
MVHVKRMAPALRWLLAVFDDVHGPLVRTHHVHAPFAGPADYHDGRIPLGYGCNLGDPPRAGR